MNYLLFILIVLNGLIVFLVLRNRPAGNDEKLNEIKSQTDLLLSSLSRLENNNHEEFRRNREELSNMISTSRNESSKLLNEIRIELSSTLLSNRKELSDSLLKRMSEISTMQKELLDSFASQLNRMSQSTEERLEKMRDTIEKKLTSLQDDNAKKLDQMRQTVDEKLQKTLNERLSQSFETVGKQLQSVQEGLGEMRTLATDVGGLKKVLSNVKMRGGIGEVQLAMLLEQILAPDQYEANVKTKQGSQELVEFAIRLPGREDSHKPVWLPVDAKFPKDVYEQLQNAYESGDLSQIEASQKNLEMTIKKMAKDIGDKYIDPPGTTDFGIMFLPFEGIYAEVVRKASLLEDLQKNYKIIVTGPTTLAAILNSLQIGFKTLAIQKRSGEVWQVLASVKKEFDSFGGMLEKAQNNIQTGLNQLDDVMGKRTRAIQRKLRGVEVLGEGKPIGEIPEVAEPEILDED